MENQVFDRKKNAYAIQKIFFNFFYAFSLIAISFTLLLFSVTAVYADQNAAKALSNHIPTTLFQAESGTTLYLNGAGLSNKFSGEVYLGALYLPEPTSSEKIAMNVDRPKRVSIYFLREKPNLRDFFSSWVENFCSEEFKREVVSEKIQPFKEILYRSLLSEKSIHLDYIPQSKATLIYSESRYLGMISDPFVFKFFLESWLGKHPPSKEFKERLLAGVPNV